MAKRDKFKETQAERINDLLNSQSYPMQSFAVPRFQRNYAWKDEADRLWEDVYDYYIEHKEETAQNVFDGQYMLGPMVILRDDGEDYEWQVIDGQQRLATLTTLFCVIRDIFLALKDKIDDDEGYKLAKNLIMRETFKNEKKPKLMLNQKDRDFFADRIQKEGNPIEKLSKWQEDVKGQKNLPPSHKLLMRCYEIMYDNVSNALIAGFVRQGQIEGEMSVKEKELEKGIIKNMVKNPVRYSLSEDFFERHWDGQEFIQDGNVSKEEREKYDHLKSKPSGSTYHDVGEYVEYIITQKDKKFKKVLTKAVKEKRPTLLEMHGIKNISMLTKFLKYVIQQNFVVSARVENENDASMIFEALNARGKPLSKSELVKNMCFKVVKTEKEIIEMDLRWMDIFNEELKSGDNFVRESLRSRYFQTYDNHVLKKSISTSTANLLKIISQIINNSDVNAKRYVAELEADSKFTKMMDTPTSYSDNEEIKYKLIALGRLNAVHIRIPLLTGYRRWGLGQEFNKFFDKLIKFHFRNITVGDMHTSQMEKIMLDVAKNVDNGKDLTDIIIGLRKKDLGGDEFEDRFSKIRIEEGESIKYILLEIEKYLRGNDQVIQLEGDATVEHILPKKPSEDWIVDEFFKGWKNDDDRDFKSHYKRIGNMTLLSKSPNSRIKNRSFCIKKTEAYSQEEMLKLTTETVLKMVKCAEELEKHDSEFQNIKEWTAVIIDERSKCFAKLAKSIWDL